MKNLILVLALSFMSVNVLACQPYFTVGIGYKIQEADKFTFNGETVDADYGRKETARFELGCEFGKGWTAGGSHDSQWFSGAPFNDEPEYHKSEIFVDYTWRF